MKKVPLGEYDDNYSLKILSIDLVAGLLIPGFLPGVILAIDNGLDTYFTFRRISQISVGAENAMKKCRCR